MSTEKKNEVQLSRPQQMVMQAKNAFEKSNKYEMDFNREANFAVQILEANPFLMKANPNSIKNAIINISLTGLTLNPALKYAYLVPRKTANSLELCLDISYIGMIKLLTDAGAVKYVNADVICENDEYNFSQGSDAYLNHKPALKDRGEMVGAYAIAYFRDGGSQFIILNQEDIHAIRACSESYKNEKSRKHSPWVKWEAEMWKKSALRRLYKILPKTDFSDKLIAAISVDHENVQSDTVEEDRLADIFDDYEEVTEVKGKTEEE